MRVHQLPVKAAVNPTTTGSAPAVFASRQPDTRRVPLDALKQRSLIGADDMPQPEPRTTAVCAFNASL